MSDSTPHQRLNIRCLMSEASLSVLQITQKHQRLFAQADLAEPTIGVDVDSHLKALTREEAARLAQTLKQDAMPWRRERA